MRYHLPSSEHDFCGFGPRRPKTVTGSGRTEEAATKSVAESARNRWGSALDRISGKGGGVASTGVKPGRRLSTVRKNAERVRPQLGEKRFWHNTIYRN